MKIKRLLLYFVLVAIVGISPLAIMHVLWPHFIWKNEPVHSTVEALGAMAAISLAIVLLHRERGEKGGNSHLFWIAIGLLGMGLLDGFHAVTRPGGGFVLLHSMAVFVGGFWFTLVWLPESNRYASIKKWIPWGVATGAILLGIWTLLFHETLPIMVQNGKFTTTAIVLNLLAGMFFIIATWRFLLDFHRSGSLEFYLFTCMALMFGLGALAFWNTFLWEDGWWFWHLLRLSAYLLVMGFLVRDYMQTFTSLRITLTERKRAEESLRESEKKYRNLVDNALVGVFKTNLRGDILYINDALVKMLEFNSPEEFAVNGALKRYKNPKDRETFIENLRKAGRVDSFETEILTKTGKTRNILLSTTLEDDTLSGMVMDITERKQAEEEIKRYTAELERSNKELQQFAYIASHDLQEPLRMIASYLQLIEQRYKGRLDKDADEFITFAVDGAGRLQVMINGLLEYSRVETRGRPFEITDTEEVLNQVLANLQVTIAENEAIITHDPLPAVIADASPFPQVLHNLISNAIKFCKKDESPHIHVSARREKMNGSFLLKTTASV